MLTGLLSGLLAPLRLPERALSTLEAATEALQHVGPLRSDVATIRSQSESLDELLPTLDALKADLAIRLDSLREIVATLEGVEVHLDQTLDRVVGEIGSIHKTVRDLNRDLERITERLPDPDAPNALERARSAIAARSG